MLVSLVPHPAPHLHPDEYPGELRILVPEGWNIYDEFDREVASERSASAHTFVIPRAESVHDDPFIYYLRQKPRWQIPLDVSRLAFYVTPDDHDAMLAYVRVVNSKSEVLCGFWVTDWGAQTHPSEVPPAFQGPESKLAEPTGLYRFDRGEVL
jgi:hypothetical protein